MHPYFHPTTLLVLDDDPYYVESFKFHFGDQFPCVSYTQPERAIEHLLAQHKQRPTFESYVEQSARAGQHQGNDQAVSPIGRILRMTADANRFRRVSVLIVDYDMPAMNGIQVCRSLHHLPVRKLLLTGKAGIDTAIGAFNEGIIDAFLTKHDPEIQKSLPRQVKRLQDEYFKATTEPLAMALRRLEAPFLSDDGVVEAVEAVIKSRRIVEHYVSAKPAGILLADANGTAMMMVLSDEEALRAQWEVARDNGAPKELLDLLATKRVIPLFPSDTGYFEPNLSTSWSRALFPAQKLAADRPWYTTLVSADQVPHIFPGRMATFAAFEELQAVGQQSN